jgi:CHASE3 domain sensor protein
VWRCCWSNTIGLRSSADATIRTDAYLERVVEVERLVVDAETGLRGYVTTGRSLFLAPLRAAEARLPQAITALHQSAASDGTFVPQALAQASRSYLSGYVPFVLGIAAHRLSDVRSFAATLTGKRLVDDVRARTATLERLVTARQDARQTTAHRSADRSVAEAIVVLVVLTVLMVVIGAAPGRLAVGQGVARERSERTNRTLQQSLLPQALPTIPGCELAVLSLRPAPGSWSAGISTTRSQLTPVAGQSWSATSAVKEPRQPR